MRVLLSRLLPVGGPPVVLALFINHCRLNFDLIIKCVSRATMDDEVLIMSSFCSQLIWCTKVQPVLLLKRDHTIVSSDTL